MIKYYMMAVAKGNHDAMENLADCYQCGTGIDKDFEEAIYWYKTSATPAAKNKSHNLEHTLIGLYINKINSSELNLAYKLLTDSSKKNKYQNRIDEVIDRIKVAKRLYVFELVNYLHANVAGIIVEYLYFYEY